jgi:ribosome-associated protein
LYRAVFLPYLWYNVQGFEKRREKTVENKAENYIKLDSFLKLRQAVSTGGQAKLSIQNGQVKVNGQVETRRGRKLYPGDEVTFQGTTYKVE